MKYFIDLEFIECQDYLRLVSIGIISEDNRKYYAISKTIYNSDLVYANEWVQANVLNSLYNVEINWNYDDSEDENIRVFKIKPELKEYHKHRNNIKQEILNFIGDDPEPQFWGEWCSYDWVCFCWIFGTMMDLPSHFPMRCRDIIQLAEDHLNISSDKLPESLEVDGNHNALLGARTVKMRYEWLLERVNEMQLKFSLENI